MDLNTATLEELTQLPGVGGKLAQRIIAARPFSTVRDLILVNGVGPKLYASLLPLVTVSPPAPEAAPIEAAPFAPTPVEGPGVEAAAPGEAAFVAPAQPEPFAPLAADVRRVDVAQPKQPEPAPTPPAEPAARVESATPHVEIPGVPEGPPTPPPTRPKPEPRPASLFQQPKMINPGKYPVRMGIYTRSSRSRYSLPGEREWRRVMLVLFYGILGLSLLGLAALVLAWGRTASRQPTSVALAGTATRPASSATAIPPTRTLAPTSRPIATSAPTPIAVATEAPSPTSAPTDTAVPSPTPLPTDTPSPTPTPTTTASPTPVPTSTPTIVAPAGAGSLLFAESFDPPQFYWGVGHTNFSRSEIRDGQLAINVNRASLAYVFGSMETAQDFYYQAATRAGPCGAGDHFGLQVRAKDDNNFYLFGVTCEGKVRVQLLLNGRYTVLVNSEVNPAVKTGEGAENVLAVRAAAGDFQFLANGEALVTVSNPSLTAGKFGLYAKSANTQVFTVTFDDVRGWTAAP